MSQKKVWFTASGAKLYLFCATLLYGIFSIFFGFFLGLQWPNKIRETFFSLKIISLEQSVTITIQLDESMEIILSIKSNKLKNVLIFKKYLNSIKEQKCNRNRLCLDSIMNWLRSLDFNSIYNRFEFPVTETSDGITIYFIQIHLHNLSFYLTPCTLFFFLLILTFSPFLNLILLPFFKPS